jgi:hypothetical protein
MGFLDFIFGKKTQKIENDFFGTMELRKDTGSYFFVCYRHFAPVNDMVETLLVGRDLDISGKETHKQEAFFKNIESNYSQICETLAPHIERAFQKKIDGFKIKDFHKEFKINFLCLPTCNDTPLDWSIQFDYFDKSSVVDGIAIVLADNKVVEEFLYDAMWVK